MREFLRDQQRGRPAPADEGQEYAEAIIRTTRQPLIALDPELHVRTANPAFYNLFQIAPEETEGRRIYDLGNGQWNISQLRRLLDRLLREHAPITDYRIEHRFQTIGRRVMLLNATRLEREGRPSHILLAISDETEKERLRHELEGRTEYAEKLIDAVREGLLVLHEDLRVRSANQSFHEMFGTDREAVEGCLVYELGNGQWDIAELRDMLERILPEEKSLDDFVVEHDFEKLGHRVMKLNARRIDHLGLILLAIRDVTERQRAEVQQNVMVGELHHRVKNILANVRSLSMQTRRNSETLDQFARAFDGRIDALARTQNLLMRSAEGTAGLHDLVHDELDAHGAELGRTFTFEGPDPALDARTAQAVEMAIHELATNAVKYGALSAAAGRIDIRCGLARRDEADWLWLHWRETGVKIAETRPKKGFGSKVIEKSLPYMLGGSVELTFHPDGAECVLSFPLPA